MRSILLHGARGIAGLLLANLAITVSRGQTPLAADWPAKATNIVELRRMAAESPVTAHSIELEGVVWWSNPDTGRFIFHDDSGSQELEVNASGRPAAGDRVRLTGNSSIVVAGAILRLGWPGVLIDHDGVHSLAERSNSLFLRAGRHPLLLDWFNGTGRFGLTLEYEGPGISRQAIPNSVLFRTAGDPDHGLNYRAYSGAWRTLPDFNSLTPIKTGTTPNFNLNVRTGDTSTGLSFSGEIEVPRDGLYTFYLKSDDGSRLFISSPTLQWTTLGRAEFPVPHRLIPGQPLSAGQPGDGWVQIEGKVIAARKNADGMRLELRAGANSMTVEIANSASLAADQLLNRRIRATGFCRKSYTLDEEQIAGTLRVPGAAQIELINAPLEPASDEPKPVALPLLVTATAVRELKPEEASRGYSVRIRGVVTCVQADRSAFVVQDWTSGLYVSSASSRENLLPSVGEFVEVNGVSGEPGIAQVQRLKRLGDGILPEPLHPGWDQLMNGSIDSQWVELSGRIESVIDRSNGWSRAMLRTRAGVMKLDLRNGGVHPGPVGQYENAGVRLRGCIFADWTPARRLKIGQARMYDVDVFVDRPAPADLFSVPRTTVDALMKFDPGFDVANQVKVAGQIVYVRGADYFIMDGKDGLRFLAREPLGLETGDLVEAVGYPELSGAAPVLRGAVARKTGHAPLPEPTLLAPEDLIRYTLDSTRVRVSGTLLGLNRSSTNLIFEMKSGSWRFLARLNASAGVRLPSVGSRLELTGVYCAQGGLQVLGEDVAPVDLLLSGISDVVVLTRPPWWTLQRLLVIVGLLACALAVTVLWITQLRHQVEERSAELAVQIRDRQQLEHQKSLEQERIRIAQDLHDELGSDIATISMLAARAQLPSAPDEKRSECLEQVRGKAKDMVGALDEIVWAMNPGHDSVGALMSYVDRYAHRFLGLANMTWQFDGVPEGANCPLDSRQRHHLFMVLKEALTNIVRHSGATQVRVDLQLEGNELRLIVVDNGRGMLNGNGAHAGESNGIGSGLDNMRSRIEKLSGRFEIVGEPGCGTEVRFVVPVN